MASFLRGATSYTVKPDARSGQATATKTEQFGRVNFQVACAGEAQAQFHRAMCVSSWPTIFHHKRLARLCVPPSRVCRMLSPPPPQGCRAIEECGPQIEGMAASVEILALLHDALRRGDAGV
jgi:hypothetical protein